MVDVIKGGKGGGSSSSATQTPDNLRSVDTVEAILGICEGPILGLTNGAKSFYVGDTQLQNESGDYNFTAFKLEVFSGTDNDDFLVPALGGTSSNYPVNLTLAYNTSVTRETQVTNIDYVDIRLAFSRLMTSNDSGVFNATVKIRIEYKPHSGSDWVNPFGQDLSISGKTTSTYVKELRIAVPKTTEDTYDIRITKLSEEDTNTYYADVAWESYQETIAGSVQYPNTALVHIVGQASDQFSSIPQWSGVYDGMIIKIPSNYNPIDRTYDGIWDGTFTMAWSNNPAWVLYDFVMNDRYGLRAYYPDLNMDKYDVYEAAQWCDESVPDGKGGTQPRYAFNAYITEPRSGKELARYIAGSFNATFFDDLNTTCYLRVDKDDDACNLFTKENIYDDGFTYSYTDITSRYNDITVTFVNPDLNWVDDRRRVFDQALIDKNGRIPLDFVAVGCTDEHQALRMAYYKLITSNTETCIVSFVTNRLGQFVNPFDVIMISDPDMGYGISGRVKSVDDTGTVITLRDPIYLEAGIEYDIRFVLSDGTFLDTTLTTALRGYNSTLVITDALPEDNYPDKTVFSLSHSTLLGTPRPFRVTKVEETDGDKITIEAISINRNKWYDADNLVDTGTINYSVLPDPTNPPGPTSVHMEEKYVKSLQEFHITISPIFDRGAYKYYANDHSFEVWSRPSGTLQPYVKRQIYFGDTLINHPDGLYDFKILGVSYLGKTSRLDSVAVYQFNVISPKSPPADVDWVKVNKSEVYWGYANPPDDFAGFVVRYQNLADKSTWDDAIPAHEGIITTNTFYTNLIPTSARVIMVKAIDVFDTTSVNQAIVYRALGDVSASNVYEETDFGATSPPFQGTKTGCSVEDGVLKADDTGTKLYSGVATNPMYDGGEFYDVSYQEMYYIDQFEVTVEGNLVVQIDFEGAGYELSIREHTVDDSEIWTPVPSSVTLTPATYDLRVRVFGGPRGIINSLKVITDPPDITEDIQDLTIGGTGLIRVPITKTYTTIKVVSVIIQDDGVNNPVSYRVIDKDVSLGPQIKLLDSSGAVSAGTVDVIIRGY